MRREARRLELKAVDEVVAIVDGAPWIRSQLQRLAGCDHIGLDFYHFSEHVAEAARACFGEGTPQSAAWRHKVVHLALEQDADAVLDEVTRQRAALRSPAKRAALSRLRNYVGERTSMIRYADNRARGWDIGSGPTESLCKTMARRLKGPGMRWDPAGADAILQLTALAGLQRLGELLETHGPTELVTPGGCGLGNRTRQTRAGPGSAKRGPMVKNSDSVCILSMLVIGKVGRAPAKTPRVPRTRRGGRGSELGARGLGSVLGARGSGFSTRSPVLQVSAHLIHSVAR